MRRKYCKYVKSARKKGYETVTLRFVRDDLFHNQMVAQGWTIDTIDEIDQGAAEAAQVGHRSKSDIEYSGRYVYRGKRFAADDETWDKAHWYSLDQVSEYKHWNKAKKGRGGGTSQTSYPSSSWWDKGR